MLCSFQKCPHSHFIVSSLYSVSGDIYVRKHSEELVILSFPPHVKRLGNVKKSH